jgi:hypothetical protein
MWIVIATIFLLTNGQPDAGHKIARRTAFETEAACKEFLNSDDFKTERQTIVEMVISHFDANHIPAMDIQAACVEKATHDDGSI